MRAIEPIINLERERRRERERLALNVSPLTLRGQWAIRPACCERRGMVQVPVGLQDAHTQVCLWGGSQWERPGWLRSSLLVHMCVCVCTHTETSCVRKTQITLAACNGGD